MCKKQYEVYPNMTEVIDQYMICTLAQGNINDAGETILKSPPTADGCTTDQQKLMGFEGISVSVLFFISFRIHVAISSQFESCKVGVIQLNLKYVVIKTPEIQCK